MSETYATILAELMRRRDALTAELNGVTSAISSIMPLVAPETGGATFRPMAQIAHQPTGGAEAPVPRPVGDYSHISVRWAALWHLAEFARGPMRNGEIADAIRAGGYHSGAGSFPNAVSAVLSGMRAKGELDGNPDAGYYLTEMGRQIWTAIRQSERFRSVMNPPVGVERPLRSGQ